MAEVVLGHSVDVIRHDVSATIELALGTIGVPSFSLETLRALLEFGRELRAEVDRQSKMQWERVILTSRDPTVFSMGGDIASIAALARDRNGTGTAIVGDAVSATLAAFSSGFGLDIETVAIVDSRAFGFGFEMALACDQLVVSPTATFGLPEGRFGLFAGMGATSLIPRRASKTAMERLVVDGATIDAAACHRLGIVDRLVEEPRNIVLEEGQAFSRADWDRNRRKTVMRRRARRYTYCEIRDGLRVWEEAVLAMPMPDIEAATRIAQMQAKRSRRRFTVSSTESKATVNL